jgi:hypothetical protein
MQPIVAHIVSVGELVDAAVQDCRELGGACRPDLAAPLDPGTP